MILVNMIAALAGLIIGSFTDLKTREVPDWLNFSMIGFGIGVHLIYAAVLWEISYVITSLAGLALGFLIAIAMFYSGQWGGGDSKMLMALGALIGLDIFNWKSTQFMYSLLLNILLVGAVYGLLWSVFLIIRHKKDFVANFRELIKTRKIQLMRRVVLIVVVLGLISLFFIPLMFRFIMIVVLFLLFFVFYVWVMVKAVEASCMIKKVRPSELTEGDWLVDDIIVDKKRICGPKDLGVTKKQIATLIEFYKKRKVRLIAIKEGVPFVPSFLLAFIVTLLFGAWYLSLI